MKGLGRVGDVLEQVLTDFGRRAADDPRRLKGLITDTLGAEASEYHDAIEAVVAAADAGVPQAALIDADDRDALIELARSHIDASVSAAEVVDVWISALRVQDRIPTDGPTMAAPVERTLPAGEPTQLPSRSEDPTILIPTADAAVAAPSRLDLLGRISAFTSERKTVALSAVGVLVLVLGGVAAASMLTGATTTSVPPTTTTSIDQIAAAGDYYLEAVGRLNCAIGQNDALWAGVEDEEGLVHQEDWDQIREVLLNSAVVGQASVSFAEALSSYDWPEVVQPAINDLIQKHAQWASWAQQFSEISSWQAYLEFDLPVPVGDSATVVRAKLGLPTNIGLDPSQDCP